MLSHTDDEGLHVGNPAVLFYAEGVNHFRRGKGMPDAEQQKLGDPNVFPAVLLPEPRSGLIPVGQRHLLFMLRTRRYQHAGIDERQDLFSAHGRTAHPSTPGQRRQLFELQISGIELALIGINKKTEVLFSQACNEHKGRPSGLWKLHTARQMNKRNDPAFVMHDAVHVRGDEREP